MKSHFAFFILSVLFCYGTLHASPAPVFDYQEMGRESHVNHLLDRSHNSSRYLLYPGSLAILPEDGRKIYFEAFAAAKREIRIEICVLEDPLSSKASCKH